MGCDSNINIESFKERLNVGNFKAGPKKSNNNLHLVTKHRSTRMCYYGKI